MDREHWIKKLKTEIVEIDKWRNAMAQKDPIYRSLYPFVENALYDMANLLLYIEDKNPYIAQFHEPYCLNRSNTMHRSFLREMHTNIEDGLRKIAEDKGITVKVTRQEQAQSIVEKIAGKVPDRSVIERDLQKVVKFAGNFPTFNDYLNAVIEALPLTDDYRKQIRAYFDALSIIRNKLSHSDMRLSEAEKQKLIEGKFRNAIASDGVSLQMTFEGYKFLIRDAVNFFDQLYSHL